MGLFVLKMVNGYGWATIVSYLSQRRDNDIEIFEYLFEEKGEKASN